MGLTGTLRIVSTKMCPQCNTAYGKHSKKQFIRCLYTANYNLYNVMIDLQELRKEVDASKTPAVIESETEVQNAN